ncbi:MAG: putative quinol monooxygenase [Pseudomonadota bacterium]
MSKLTITGNVKVKPEHVDFVKEELLKLIPITRKEAGCIQYDLHQDNDDPTFFLFYENWESRELWQTHMNNDHLQAYMKATDGMVEKFWLHELTFIG